jgi:hypothetical protein
MGVLESFIGYVKIRGGFRPAKSIRIRGLMHRYQEFSSEAFVAKWETDRKSSTFP